MARNGTVRDDAELCKMVQIGAGWCGIVRDGLDWRAVVLDCS